MGLLSRFTRLCKADIHGVMDQLEDKQLVLRQCLREMEEVLERKRGRLDALKDSLERYHQEKTQLKSDREKIEEDLHAAIHNEKDDIARLVIKKLKILEGHIKAMELNAAAVEKEVTVLAQNIEIQKHQYSELKLRSKTYANQKMHAYVEKPASFLWPNSGWTTISEEEIELELMRRKALMKGGH